MKGAVQGFGAALSPCLLILKGASWAHCQQAVPQPTSPAHSPLPSPASSPPRPLILLMPPGFFPLHSVSKSFFITQTLGNTLAVLHCCLSFSVINSLTRWCHLEQLEGNISFVFLWIHTTLPKSPSSAEGSRTKPLTID